MPFYIRNWFMPILTIFTVSCINNSRDYVEKIKWDGENVTEEDFISVRIELSECDSDFACLSHFFKSPSRLRILNDSLIAYCENKDFNLLRILNVRTGEMQELVPVSIDSKSGTLSTISQILKTDNGLWLTDWNLYRICKMINSDSIWTYQFTEDFTRAIPIDSNRFVYMPGSKDNIRIKEIEIGKEPKVISKEFPPVKHDGILRNNEVQGEMDVSPDMSYFVISTFGWDFIEIHTEKESKMIRGPFFNETRYVNIGLAEPYMLAKDKITFSNLRVYKERFAIGIAEERLDEQAQAVLKEIRSILIFSKKGKPLYKLELPEVILGFDIDFTNNKLIALTDYLHPRILQYKLNKLME